MALSAAARKRHSRQRQTPEKRQQENEKAKLDMQLYRQNLSVEGRAEYNRASARRMKRGRDAKKLAHNFKNVAAPQDDDKFTSKYKNRQARAKTIQRLIRQLPNDSKGGNSALS